MIRSLRTLRSIARLKDIALVLGRHGFHQVASSLHSPLTSRLSRLFRREPGHIVQQPERLRMVLEDLGPTFIKFGQLLSTRPDLLPPPYIRELEKLQDDVPPEPFDEVQRTLKAEFPGSLSEHFQSIDPEPLAAASIAQVHRAVTRDGADVVVKVRKRGLEKVIEQDLLVLGLLTDFLSDWPGLRLFDPEGVLRVFERSIRRELNFEHERNSLQRLRDNLAPDSRIYFPRPYPELSTSRVLTMEFLRGEKLLAFQRRGLPRARGEEIAVDLARGFLRQIFEDGFFHADSHPGNIILMEDGRVGLIDVGNVGRLTPEMTDDLVALLTSLVRQDYRALSRWILRHGRPTKEVDPRLLAIELMDQLDPYFGLRLDEIRIGDLLNALFSMAMRHGITVPSQYVTVGRTFVLVEGAVRLCAPQIDILTHMRPAIAGILRQRWSPGRLAREAEAQASELIASLRSVPTNLAELLARAAEGRLRVESHSEELIRVSRKLDVLAARVPLAIVVAALLLGSVGLLCVPEGARSGSLSQILGLAGLATSVLMGLRFLLR